MSEESIKNLATPNNSFAPILIGSYPFPDVKFSGNFLRQSGISAHKNIVNLYISYRLNIWSKHLNPDFILYNCLFGAVKWTKNAEFDKYGHSGYGIGFNARSQYFYFQTAVGIKCRYFCSW